MAKIMFPCDREGWWRVKDHLVQLKHDCIEGLLDMEAIVSKLQAAVDINFGATDPELLPSDKSQFYGLAKYYRKSTVTPGEVNFFITVTLPQIIDLALEVETLLPTEGIPVNLQQKNEVREIPRLLCCSIVACAFLCLFSNEARGYRTRLNGINFNKFFSNLPLASQNAKLLSILHFFNRVTEEKDRLTGNIVFSRQVMKQEEMPTLDTWLNCSAELCQVIVHAEGRIEDAGCNTVEVDFANRYIGGGVLGRGRVQEEIRFCVCPELLVSLLFMETMDDNEAIIISGFEQFSIMCGYAAGLEFDGDHRDPCTMDEQGNLRTMMCAIDAVSYRSNAGRGGADHRLSGCAGRQYLDQWVLRDLNKAFIGFCTPFDIPSHAFEPPVSDDDFYTAEDSRSAISEITYLPLIDRFVDDLLARALSLALPAASRALAGHDLTGSVSSADAQSSLSSLEHYLHRQSSMDHLEVNFRDWYAQYRRRSSNLSDLSSRRSSCDVASRRSSACSARGYSSEFSSEFEEYYDNFQLQDQRYKYHTIAEEVGSPAVIEFASCLAASLLREGAHEAAVMRPQQKFHEYAPQSGEVERPTPVRVLCSGENGGEPEHLTDENEICVRRYVDDWFERLWPFSDSVEFNTSLSEEVKHRIATGCKSKTSQRNVTGARCHGEAEVSCPSDDSNDNVGELRDMLHHDMHIRHHGSDCTSSDSVSVCTEYSIVEVDDEIMLAVADRIVAIAFQEALLECKYTLNRSKLRPYHSFSESSQSDHSMEARDQSESLLDSSNLSVRHYTGDSQKLDPAMIVAEKMMSGLFSKKEPLGTGATGTSANVMEPGGAGSKPTSTNANNFQQGPSSVKNSGQHGNENEAGVADGTGDCDNMKVKVIINQTLPTQHSLVAAGDATALASNSQSVVQGPSESISSGPGQSHSHVSQRQLDMYERIADRILGEGMTSGSCFTTRSCQREGASTASVPQMPSSVNDSNDSATQSSKNDPCDSSNQYSSSLPMLSHTDEQSQGNAIATSSHKSSKRAPSSEQSNTDCSTVDNNKPSNVVIVHPNAQSSNTSKVDSNVNKTTNANVETGAISKVPSLKINRAPSSSKGSKGHHSSKNAASSGGHKLPSSSPETTSSSDSSGALGAVGGAVPSTGGGSSRRNLDPNTRPVSQSKMKPKPGHPFITGNKKNFDQFANSLSRDLLTNAFLQVQEHCDFVSYPRRSSEPMQISNGAALQRLQHSVHFVNGQRSQKSKTAEDIATFEGEWLSQFISTSSSCGFRDPVLSRFAEELMKANISVPPLQLLGDGVSISSSSQSVCSTMSSFRDPLLSSFEEELLNNVSKPVCAKTQTSWSKMKGLMCSSRQGGKRNSQGGASSKSGGGYLNSHDVSVHSNTSGQSRPEIYVSMSIDSENSGASWRSCSLAHVNNASDFADTLARRILCEALTAIYCAKSRIEEGAYDRQFVALDLYSSLLAHNILSDAMETTELLCSDWLEQNKVVTWSDEMECRQIGQGPAGVAREAWPVATEAVGERPVVIRVGEEKTEVQYRHMSRELSSCGSAPSSGDFEDALDVPYQRLEEFADVLATKVLINSVAITRREQVCNLRKRFGRPIATGNWGCGAFGGDPHLKSLIQWMAASYAGCPTMLYYTFQNHKVEKFQEVVDLVLQRGWGVSQLMQVVRRYCIIACEEIEENGAASRELYDVILQGEIFPGL